MKYCHALPWSPMPGLTCRTSDKYQPQCRIFSLIPRPKPNLAGPDQTTADLTNPNPDQSSQLRVSGEGVLLSAFRRQAGSGWIYSWVGWHWGNYASEGGWAGSGRPETGSGGKGRIGWSGHRMLICHPQAARMSDMSKPGPHGSTVFNV